MYSNDRKCPFYCSLPMSYCVTQWIFYTVPLASSFSICLSSIWNRWRNTSSIEITVIAWHELFSLKWNLLTCCCVYILLILNTRQYCWIKHTTWVFKTKLFFFKTLNDIKSYLPFSSSEHISSIMSDESNSSCVIFLSVH